MEPLIKPEYIEKLTHEVIVFLPRIPIAIVLFFVGGFLIKMMLKALRFAMTRRGVDLTLVSFLSSVANALLQVLLIVTVASTVGIATTSFVAMIGAAGLAVGLALQGSLSNFAGSVLLMVFKPFKAGDFIVAQGQEGTVRDINIFNTVLLTVDNRRVIIPNGALAGGVIVNVNAEDHRRVEINIGINYSDDFKRAEKVLLELASNDQRVRNTPAAPFVGISNFGESSVDLVFRFWVDSEDRLSTIFDMMSLIKAEFDKAGIDIPYPQRVVHTIVENRDSSNTASPKN